MTLTYKETTKKIGGLYEKLDKKAQKLLEPKKPILPKRRYVKRIFDKALKAAGGKRIPRKTIKGYNVWKWTQDYINTYILLNEVE